MIRPSLHQLQSGLGSASFYCACVAILSLTSCEPSAETTDQGTVEPLSSSTLSRRFRDASIVYGGLHGRIVETAKTDSGTWYLIDFFRKDESIWSRMPLFISVEALGTGDLTFPEFTPNQELSFKILEIATDDSSLSACPFAEKPSIALSGFPFLVRENRKYELVRPSTAPKEVKEESAPVLCEVLEIAAFKDPATLPYPDLIGFVRLRSPEEGEILCGGEFIKNRVALPLAELQKGDEVSVETLPISEAPEKWGEKARVETTGENDWKGPGYWIRKVEIVSKATADEKRFKPVDSKVPKQITKIRKVLSSHTTGVLGTGDHNHFIWFPSPDFYNDEVWAEYFKSDKPEVVPQIAKILKSKGSNLMIVIKPDAATLVPGFAANLHYDYKSMGRVDYQCSQLLDYWRSKGVPVIDPTEEWLKHPLLETPLGKYPPQLKTNGHWSSAAARSVANMTADVIREKGLFTQDDKLPPLYSVEWEEESHLGDLRVHFKEGFVKPEAHAFARVAPASNASKIKSKVSAIGPSHIWFPEGGGFYDHLSVALNHPVTAIYTNGDLTGPLLRCIRDGMNDQFPELIVWVMSTPETKSVDSEVLSRMNEVLSVTHLLPRYQFRENESLIVEYLEESRQTDWSQGLRFNAVAPTGKYSATVTFPLPETGDDSIPPTFSVYLTSSLSFNEGASATGYSVKISQGKKELMETSFLHPEKTDERQGVLQKLEVPLIANGSRSIEIQIDGEKIVKDGKLSDDPVLLSPILLRK